MLDNSSIAILVISCLMSFGVGRLVLRWRKRRQASQAASQAPVKRAAEDEPASLNKGKRRRQQRQSRRDAR